MIDRTDTQWYRDAIIYQLHVKSFFDANNDGVGDFIGVTQKLDYIKELGATAIWVMPFYPSPLRDDGYDISDYRGINPSYGTPRDFKLFVKAAHERGIRVITELVINHTSDQHPWFQRARAAKKGSAAREFYVWSDTEEKYKDTRIIFLDTEKSNWTWDEKAQAFYWHRFYSHQPDLNFDNPRVIEAVLDVMRYWLDLGVDGLRLDAIPYLCEREGTNCENLEETHKVLKIIRAEVDKDYPDRMLLAEANQWPEETAQYFGDGDECHMAFHFPLMPRIYMALAQEDRHPITDIMRQTPEIPEGCQWSIFLRNHDEMTLEMVTDKERDYLWKFYAADKRARINLGIRRRLAPLLDNDRRKIELLNSLLLSMPGTPCLYYGDEIGMGDNIYLGDRDGVRTPMQWSVDRNGGFSRADPQKLFLPTIQDSTYGFQAVNVEAQLASPTSMINWLRRMIAVRRSHKAMGRGSLKFLYPQNRKVLAYLRELDDETILCVVNVSNAPQAVELDMSEYNGTGLTELTAGTSFPRIGELPYLLTLPAYGFYWFRLEKVSEDGKISSAFLPELFTLVAAGPLENIFAGRELKMFETTAAPSYLATRRWFAAKGARIGKVSVRDYAVLREPPHGRYMMPLVSVPVGRGEEQIYFMPLAADLFSDEDDSLTPFAVARLRRAARMGLLYDADASPDFAAAMINVLRIEGTLKTTKGGEIRFTKSPLLDEEEPVDVAGIRRMGAEQSNSSINIDDRMALKIYRRLQPGANPEVEIGRFLTDVAHFKNAPPTLGVVEHVAADGTVTAIAVLQRFVRNQGDAWTWTLNVLTRIMDAMAFSGAHNFAAAQEGFEAYTPHMRRLGHRTAEMHKALATQTDDQAFAAEPLTLADVEEAARDARALADKAFARLERLSDGASDNARALAERLIVRKRDAYDLIDHCAVEPVGAIKTRIHGDYHLGQVLVVKDDVVIIDFEGEPARTLEERRMKASPLRDVAGMLRSFAYAVATARRRIAERLPEISSKLNEELIEFSEIFVDAYMESAKDSPIWIDDEATQRRLLILYTLSKAFYEIDYEAGNRPDWIDIPIEGVLTILDYVAEAA
ncbi:Maltose alpha-D-glucosyltransferase [Beijerinckiaceae bacterium RH AL1]|nr:maltose alpha-D-glucosyltransferase [Beijerinckiaceae bacterium]VVB47188.1 Maltose alpha-D-glucosyltransferase [Beijerinckiaceae bacterium RH CH11]VVB47271.1 Maltose alpha-D-glucosyltransferase [Beijerinckiaceae bacterium RH AL8]VVC55759.1 Maltose alpha-D-glucosyltransferase [Beijerinckiaceae bacterium RH AL1]